MKTRLGLAAALAWILAAPLAHAGSPIPNGWYNGTEIYYIDQGLEKQTERKGASDIFLIGGNRLHQANVVLTVPGDPGYSPHWDVNVVHTASGVTVQDLIANGLASSRFATDGVVFDDARKILEAERRGLVTIVEPGLVVLCPIVSESVAHTPGHGEAPETFVRLETTSSF